MATKNKISSRAAALLKNLLEDKQIDRTIASLSNASIAKYNDYNLRRMFVERDSFGVEKNIDALKSGLLLDLIRLR